MAELDKERTVYLLNRILESELAGVVRYTHYSLLVFGHNRIPIVSWMREQAAESLTHAQQAGEMITMLGEYPSLTIGPLLDSYQHDVDAIMRESLESEAKALALYRELLKCAEAMPRSFTQAKSTRCFTNLARLPPFVPSTICLKAAHERKSRVSRYPFRALSGLDQMTLLIKVAEGHTRRRPGPWNCPRPARGAPKNRKAQLAEPDDTL